MHSVEVREWKPEEGDIHSQASSVGGGEKSTNFVMHGFCMMNPIDIYKPGSEHLIHPVGSRTRIKQVLVSQSSRR